MNPYKDIEDSNSFTTSTRLSYEDIATKLLKDHYFLTALELHTELVESGRELPQLREFFSNPGNFEQHVSRASEFGSMHRTPSQATLDSLDTARYSEDGGGERGGSGNDVAVLEFELRKARETIHALRANLTQFADSESNTLDKNVKGDYNQRSLKPHEKRALNFLVNEYLLLQDYKLTSITFSDENPDQEFEDWDDVGLNMPRPAGLESLFWGNATISTPKADASTETEPMLEETHLVEEENVCVSCQTSIDNDSDWNHELLIQAEEIELLKQKIIALEMEKLNFQKLYDAAIISLNSLTSPASEKNNLELQIPEERVAKKLSDRVPSQIEMERALESRPITYTALENHYGSSNSTNSATPEQFEMIDSEKNSVITKKEGSNTSSFDPVTNDTSVRDSPIRRSSVTTLDETLSINDNSEWTRVPYEYNSLESCSKEMWIDSGLPTSLKEQILTWCSESLSEPLSNDLLNELENNEKPITLTGLLTLVADTMPRILPHTLVGRRCEVTALLAATAALLPPGGAKRAKTLQALLTLVKRPTKQDTRAICDAACIIVKWGGGGEVLSAVAELLSSKSPERRILASQICVSIAPYVPIELCTSLLLSLVLLMCESSENEIRRLGLKAVCLICPVAEHKYGQIENLMFCFLKDSLENNVKDTINIFVPILARTALITGKYSSDLLCRIMSNLVKLSSENDWKSVVLYLQVLRQLVLSNLAYVTNVQILRDVTVSNCDIETVNLHDVPLKSDNEFFLDLQCYVSENVDAKALLVAMNSLFKDKCDVRWTELTWFIDLVNQILEVSTNTKPLSHPSLFENLIALFSSYVENFGVKFTAGVLKPIFVDIITDLEQKMEKLHTVSVDSTVVVGLYLATVLPVIENETQQAEFLQKWVVYGSIRGLPVKMFSIPLKWVVNNQSDTLSRYLQHIREFAASSCESTTGASIRIYITNLIIELVNTTDVGEETIEKQLLPTIVALLHDDEVSVREIAFTAWGSITRTCLTRSIACEEQCWPPVEDILTNQSRLSAKEVARVAEALSLLVLPTPDSRAVSEKAVSLLCSVCGCACAASLGGVSALAPGLQLAVHHAAGHPALLPALRKLEEVVQSPPLSQFKPAIEALIHNITGAPSNSEPVKDNKPSNLQTAQEVGRRVTQMFQQSKTNMNLPNIFKKKT